VRLYTGWTYFSISNVKPMHKVDNVPYLGSIHMKNNLLCVCFVTGLYLVDFIITQHLSKCVLAELNRLLKIQCDLVQIVFGFWEGTKEIPVSQMNYSWVRRFSNRKNEHNRPMLNDNVLIFRFGHTHCSELI
jgi:hypothetical protein